MLLSCMLHRLDKDGLIVITQPAHAWISGQLARNWGNQTFGNFAPAEEVCLAAEQHDIGFLEWEQTPALNRKTGLPETFLEMPTEAHLEIWSKGIRQMMRFGRYPALLVSMHFTFLCQQHPARDGAEAGESQQQFLQQQQQLQSAIRTSLLNDAYYAPWSTDEIIQRNRQLVSLWDWLSLLLCMGFAEEQVILDVPSANGTCQLVLAHATDSSSHLRLTPWPFQSDTVRLICEGRRLLKTWTQETELHEALKAASPLTLCFDFVKGE